MKAVVLAGGKSSRMGQDKALILFNEKPLLLHIANILQEVNSKVYISGKKGAYNSFPYPQIADVYPEKGPLGGIYSALEYCKDDILVCPCDMPFINTYVLYFLLLNYDSTRINVLEFNGQIFPTLGIYPYNVASALKTFIENDILQLQKVLTALNAQKIAYPVHPNTKKYFTNLNTPEDLKIQTFSN